MKNIYVSVLVASLVTLFGAQEALAQYCVPTMGNSWGYISEAKSTGAVSNFSNATGTANGTLIYQDYSATMGVTTFPGQTFTLSGKRSYAMMIYIDWNADGDFTDAGEEVHSETNTSATERTFSRSITVPATAAVGKMTRIRFFTGWNRYKNPCGFNNGAARYGGEAEDYFLFITYDNNAGVTKFDNPSAECNGSAGKAVNVTFQNRGVDNLDTLYFGGYVKQKGIPGRTPMPTAMWTGSLKTSESVNTPFNVYNHTFDLKGGDSVCVWSFNPNNVPDSASADDTLCYEVLTGMRGTFTVGDTTAGAHDFRSLHAAIDSITLAGAICDSVIIELSDTSWSTYRGQYQIKDIIGTSPTSPIIIRPKASNMYQTRIWFDSLTEDYDHVFLLENTSDIYFEGINFSATSGRSNGYETNVRAKNSDRINLIDCSFMNSQTARNSNDYDLVHATGTDGLKVMNCNFTNGSSSVHAVSSNDIYVAGSTFREMYARGVNLEASNNVTIMKNSFTSSSILTNGAAILLDEVNNSVEISYNTINVARNQWPQNGIFMDNCNALNSSSEVFNNMINIGQPWSGNLYHAIHLNDVVGTSVVYNTGAVSGNNANNAALYSNGGTRNTAFNNILAAMINGFAVHTPVAASIVSGDYNNVYSAGGTTGRLGSTNSASLQDWQNATGLDVNSVAVNPFFYRLKSNDLHVCNDKLFQAGNVITSIKDDWDGDQRDPNKPCIGADEFAPVSQFSLGNGYGLCDGDTTFLVAGKGLTGELAIWKDGAGTVVDTAQTLTVTSPGKYDVTLLNACGVNADSIEIIAPVKVVLTADTNICPGLTVNVDATTTNGQNYVWSGGQTSAALTVSNAGTYFVTATDKWTCVSSDSINVTYSDQADINVGDTIVCQFQPFDVFGGTSIQQPNVSYKWFGFDNDPGNVDIASVDYDFMSAQDTVLIAELTHRGCVTRDSIKVSKKPSPRITGLNFSTNGLGLYINNNGSTGENHAWDFGDGNSAIWSTNRHLYNAKGTYTVRYTNSNICGSKDTTFEVAIFGVGIDGNDVNSSLSIYPNPNNGQFNVQLKDINANQVSIKIIDAQGKQVLYKELGQVAGSANETISLNNASAGVYLIQLNIDGNIQLAKITIE